MTEYDWADTLETDFADRLPALRDDRDWRDAMHELADAAVPVYNGDRVSLWLDMGMPDLDDPGLIDTSEGVDVIHVIGVVIYEQATQRLYELATAAGLD